MIGYRGGEPENPAETSQERPKRPAKPQIERRPAGWWAGLQIEGSNAI
jgi:hypothetical protein